MRMNPAVFLLVLAVALAGCTQDITTDPTTFSLEPGRLSHLKRPQALALLNSIKAESKHPFRLKSSTWVFDERELTNTAIAMLGRGMAEQGLAVDPKAEKTITMQVRVLGAGIRSMPFHVRVLARVGLRAEFGDGTSTYVEADNSSPATAPRAFDGATLFALQQLLADEKFIAYVNR